MVDDGIDDDDGDNADDADDTDVVDIAFMIVNRFGSDDNVLLLMFCVDVTAAAALAAIRIFVAFTLALLSD